jgi:hypothetical protein
MRSVSKLSFINTHSNIVTDIDQVTIIIIHNILLI